MPLVTMDDFSGVSPTDGSRMLADVIGERINRADPVGWMPPVSSEALPQQALDTLNAWLDGGQQAGIECTGAPSPPVDEPTGPEPERDPTLTCYDFLAHAPASLEAPYQVGAARDAYFNFSFNAPWEGTQYAKEFRVVLDNAEVVHHYLMYKDPVPHANAGAVTPSIGAHPGGELVHGWAPGGEDLILKDGIGIELPATGFTLELHYNSSNPSATDRSGLEICVLPEKPENVAAVSWLGTDAINGTSAAGVCSPATTAPIRILGGTPHMHTQGRHMKVEILRASGATEILHDQDFDFEFQRAYDFQDQEIWLMPGDRVRTTCTWARPVVFGEGTGDEMCYFFTLHYPALALAAPGLDDLIHGPNTCGVL